MEESKSSIINPNQSEISEKSNQLHISNSEVKKNKPSKESLKAVEDYKKLCIKTYSTPNILFISQLKNETMQIFLDTYNWKDSLVFQKILGKYHYFKQIFLSPYNPEKGNPSEKKKKGLGITTPLTQSEKEKQSKDQKDLQNSRRQMIFHIIQGISKNLMLSESVISFTWNQLSLSEDWTAHLSEGIYENKSWQAFTITNCELDEDAYEILWKGWLTHTKIEFVDLSNNNFNDKYGNMISRIIARQTQRRDQVIWSYGLRNELPLTNDYTKGWISLNWSRNQLGDVSADCISNALSYDQYIRAVDISSNNFTTDACKKFNYMLRKNFSILNLDWNDNPGYDPEIHARIVMKMSKNIKHLYEQFQNKKYSKDEFNYYKQFINMLFFDIDIPEEILNEYNDALNSEHQISKSQKRMDSKSDKDAVEDKNHRIQRNKEYGKDVKDKKSNSKYNKSGNSSEMKNDNNTNHDNAISEEYNNEWVAENIKLHKEILELKAQNLRSEINSNKSSSTSNFKTIEANYNKIVTLLNEVNQWMGKTEDSLRDVLESNDKKGKNNIQKEKEVQQKGAEKEKNAGTNKVNSESEYEYQEMNAEPSELHEEKSEEKYGSKKENMYEEEEYEDDDGPINENQWKDTRKQQKPEYYDFADESGENEDEDEIYNPKMNKINKSF